MSIITKIADGKKVSKGEDHTLILRLTESVTSYPTNLATFQGVTGSFYAQGSDEPVSITGTNPETNVIQFEMTEEQTALLRSGDDLDFEYQWEQNGNLFIERVESQLTVLESLF